MQTLRSLALVVAFAVGLGAAPAAAAEDAADTLPSLLHEHILTNERVVRLGDLFSNTGEKAEIGVTYAPEPGKRLVLDARWLFRVAAAYGLDWRPMDGTVQAVVERDAIAIPMELIKEEILFALSDQGLGENIDLAFSAGFQQIFIPAADDPTLRVDAVDYRPRTGRFVALLSAGGGRDMRQLRITGRAFETVEVPVLNARVQRGDPIRDHHIEWIKAKAERVQNDVVLDASDIVGMTPRRGLRPGQPIRANDITRPMIVERNGLVTIVHKVLNMSLTAQGRALQAGAMGETVQVKNAQSSMIIDAEIIGPGRVAVRSASQKLSMNLN